MYDVDFVDCITIIFSQPGVFFEYDIEDDSVFTEINKMQGV